MDQTEKVRLQRIVNWMCDNNGLASKVAKTKIDSVVQSFAKSMPDGFTTAELENEFRELIRQWPSVLEEVEPSPQQVAAAKANDPNNPKNMTAEGRLKWANAKKLAEMEAAASDRAKAVEGGLDQAQNLSAAQRLRLANSWGAVGVNLDELESRGPTEAQIKSNAALRLAAANAEIARKKAKS